MKNTIYFKFLVLFAMGFLGLQVNAQSQVLKDSSSVTQETEDSKVLNFADEMPEFPGGVSQLYEYLSSNLKYTEVANLKRIEGKVIITFVVIASGEITEVNQVGSKLGYGLDEEAIRVVKAMPKWNPGRMNGVPVKVRFSLPIKFQLR